ncbi:helix-turn-helix domain-containing protein [Allofustis seminis]|uniref:helix-turn-helix domain-containing protein n=1 Tax=Allofustis seminis TaxID=166939 RepID=UPI0003752488|nr:helix-turn-helix transcriptional regulator [Allofustis seminis]
MYADSEKIKWLLKNATQYRIAKETGVPQPTLSTLANGKTSIENISLGNASKLTEYADRLMEEND